MCDQTIQSTPNGRSRTDIPTLALRCLEFEQRNLSENSLNELRCYFREIVAYCRGRGIHWPDELTPEFLKDYLDQRCKDVGPTTKKAVKQNG